MRISAQGSIFALLLVITNFFSGLLLEPLYSYFPNMSIRLILSQAVNFFIPVIIYLFITRQKFLKLVPLKRINNINIGFISLITIASLPLVMAVASISSLFFHNYVSDIMETLSDRPLYSTLLALALIPAISEEVAFRGVLLSEYRNISILKAAIKNGILFGLMHLNPQQFFYAFLLGIVLTYFVHYTGSVLASILSHLINNVFSVVLSWVSFRTIESNPELVSNVQEPLTYVQLVNYIVFLVILCAIFFPVFIILFKTFIKYNKHRMLKEDFKEFNSDKHEAVVNGVKTFDWSFGIVAALLLAATAGLYFSSI